MSLVEKIKRIPKIPLALFLSVSILFGGCATTAEKKYRPTGNDRITTTTKGHEERQKKIFDISDPHLENEFYKIKIKESLKKINYEIVDVNKEREFEEIEIKKSASEWNILVPLGLGLLGGYIGREIAEDPESNSEALTGLGVGAGLGLLIVASHPMENKTERKTGRTKRESSVLRTEKNILSENSIYSNHPAKEIEVSISHGSKKGYLKTDDAGLIGINWQIAEWFGVSWSPSKKTLDEHMGYFNPLTKQIKSSAMQQIRPRLSNMISQKNLSFLLETVEQPSNSLEEVENDSKKVNLKGYQLTDDAVYRVVKDFVDSNINSRIKTLEFTVKDITTHTPIYNSNFIIKTSVPSKSFLVGEFFTNELKNYANDLAKDYITRPIIVENSDYAISFNVYTPSQIFVEVTHPNYKFVSGKINIKDDMRKTVYMVDKGSKIRVEEESIKGGRIE